MTEASQMIQLACPVHQKLALPAVVDRNALDWGRLSWARVINHLWCSPDWQLYGTSSIQPRIGQKDKTKLVTSAVTVCLHVFLRGQDMFLEHIWQMFNRMKLPIWPNPNKLIPLQKTSKTSFSKSKKNSIKTFSPLLFSNPTKFPRCLLFVQISHGPFPPQKKIQIVCLCFLCYLCFSFCTCLTHISFCHVTLPSWGATNGWNEENPPKPTFRGQFRVTRRPNKWRGSAPSGMSLVKGTVGSL